MKKTLLSFIFCTAAAMTVNAQGTIYAEEKFDWLQPFTDAFSLSDPVGTDNAENSNFINFEPGNGQKVDGKNPMNIFWDDLGYRTRIWPQSACYEIFAYKNYLRFGGNEARNYGYMTAGMRWLSQYGCPSLPDYPDELYLSFDWCPYKDAEGNYDEIELMIETRFGSQDLANLTEITHDLKEGDPMKWIHVEIDLYNTGASTPHLGPLTNYMIQPIPAYQAGGKHRYYLDNLMLHTESTTSAVKDVSVDENAPIEYFNLQGVRVDSPKSGLYIRRQGNVSKKVFFN